MNDGDEEDELIWGGKRIGEVIERTPRQAFRLLEAGALPARKIMGRWVSGRRKLRRHLLSEESANVERD